MYSKVFSVALQGISSQLIEVESVASKGLRSFSIVGLGDKSIEEAKERVSAAVKSALLSPPFHQTKKVLINLAPADLKKEGSHFDLPIALSYLLASGQTKFNPQGKIFAGELSLDGNVKPIKGALSFSSLAKEKNFVEIILPKENAKEASLINLVNSDCPIKIVGVNNLKETISYLEGRRQIENEKISPSDLESNQNFEIDFGWIKGQEHAKRGLEIAASGGHNLLFYGPPGAGKTLLAKSVVSILPKLDFRESLELTKIYSSAGLLKDNDFFIKQRPFRNPHHTCSETALVGGGNPIRPGEITLAHRGILFLDEFPEFHRDVLESLRGPIEQREISVQRAKYNLNFPANFTLVAAANPCPCGFYNDPEKECSCMASQISSYRRKLSGPLMDRIDIFCWVPSLKYEDLISPDKNNQSEEIRKRVEKTRGIQKNRFIGENILTNSEMNIPQIKKYCPIDNKTENILRRYVDSGKLSARGFHRILKVSRTIADLDGNENISFENVSEALNYRFREET